MKKMNKKENDPLCKSVEHMIPNTALIRNRNKGEGDFYACRKCNIRKSDIDCILGIIAKAQSKNDELAIKTVQKALDNPKRNKRFIEMFVNASKCDEFVHMTMPIKTHELSLYIDFLAKGQYFKKHLKPLNLNLHMVDFQLVNRQEIIGIEKHYQIRHGRNPLQDLQNNPKTEVIENGECLIYSNKKEYLFFFHGGLGFIIKIKRRSQKNEKQKRSYLSTFSM